ncbi:SdrD B-like domain-containing protein [Fibrella arboris]|uniref:SdrD B-like domain-containing protein n=1 Tax=Fibrella arboris TaxID=3242486 RepID=UPI003522227A
MDNDCGLTITTTVSGCYSVSGLSRATASVEVSWTAIPDGGVISVQLGDQTKTITVRDVSTASEADVRSPQLVAFEIDPTNALLSVSASYESGTTVCSVSRTFMSPAPCPSLSCAGLGGTVFNDFNADGIHQPGESTGLPDILVRAITPAGTVLTTTTDSTGKYTLALPTAAYPVRVEFGNVPTYAGNGTPVGADGQTTVQFVNGPDCAVDLGVLNAQEYCQNDPLIIVPCFVNGDPLPAGGVSGSLDALVALPYSLRGNKDMSRMTPLANAGQVGSLWGTAYNKFTKRLYSSAVVRRHVGLGPGGIGGIYVTDMTGPNLGTANTSLLVNLNDIGINLGSLPTNTDRGLQPEPRSSSHDSLAFSAVGKVGIGDMDLAEDGSLLWFTNLSDGQLYSLRVPASGAPGPTDWAAHPLPLDTLCSSGVRRIWGVKTYQGKVYVGAVCDASLSKHKQDLRAVVLAYTPGPGNSLGSGGTFKVIFDFPLTYPKGAPDWTDFSIRGWFPWEDSFDKLTNVNRTLIHPQPLLADIQFDIDGSMVLGFNDRSGMQLGFENANTNSSDAAHYTNISGGDILRAYFSNGTYILENGGQAGPNTGSSTTNNEGPGAGEFYNDNFYYGGVLVHSENVNGALAIRPGSGEVVVSTMDPLNDQSWSGGIRFLSNTTGYYTSGSNATSSYVIYRTLDGDGATFGKATGLGGVTLSCDLPSYLQVGNRVWQDDDHDGEQDANEKGLAGVQVALYQNGTSIATTTTDANGNYYFTYSPTSSTVAGTTPALLPNTTYQLVFGAGGQFVDNVLTEAGGRYQLTTANATGGTLNDTNDSDAEVSTLATARVPVVNLTTGNLGSVDHSFDVGFYCLPTTVATVQVTAPTCPASGTVANDDGRIELSGIQNGDKTFLFTSTVPPAYTATSTSRVVTNGSVTYTDLPNPTSSSGTSYSIIIYNGPCCFTVISAVLPQRTCVPALSVAITPGECSTMTNEYTLTGVLSLTNAITDTALLTDGNRTTTLSITAGATFVPYSLTGFASGSGQHTLTVSYAGQLISQTYTAPLSCTVPADILVSNTVVCAGESVLLTATGCALGSIQWSSGTVITSGRSVLVSTADLLTLRSPTVLTYTATCTLGTSTAVAAVSVQVNPKPVIGPVTTLCDGPAAYSLILMGVVNAVSYELARGSSFEAGVSVTTGPTGLPVSGVLPLLQQAGTYWVRVYSGTGCFTEVAVEIQPCDCSAGKCLPIEVRRIR